MGIAIVVPISKVFEVLEQGELQQEFEKHQRHVQSQAKLSSRI